MEPWNQPLPTATPYAEENPITALEQQAEYERRIRSVATAFMCLAILTILFIVVRKVESERAKTAPMPAATAAPAPSFAGRVFK